jgi:hypothetical protein
MPGDLGGLLLRGGDTRPLAYRGSIAIGVGGRRGEPTCLIVRSGDFLFRGASMSAAGMDLRGLNFGGLEGGGQDGLPPSKGVIETGSQDGGLGSAVATESQEQTASRPITGIGGARQGGAAVYQLPGGRYRLVIRNPRGSAVSAALICGSLAEAMAIAYRLTV